MKLADGSEIEFLGKPEGWCDYCDPEYFIIYGICKECGRRCEPPLFDPNGDVDFFDHLRMAEKWNEERK